MRQRFIMLIETDGEYCSPKCQSLHRDLDHWFCFICNQPTEDMPKNQMPRRCAKCLNMTLPYIKTADFGDYIHAQVEASKKHEQDVCEVNSKSEECLCLIRQTSYLLAVEGLLISNNKSSIDHLIIEIVEFIKQGEPLIAAAPKMRELLREVLSDYEAGLSSGTINEIKAVLTEIEGE